MDKIQKIALSKIADVMAQGQLVLPAKDNWRKIFNNAGQSELNDEYDNLLSELRREEDFQVYYENNSRTYFAILNIISTLIDNSREFVFLMNEYLDKASFARIFRDDIAECIGQNRNRYFDIKEHLKKKDPKKAQVVLNEYPSKNLKLLKNNLNILAYDISFNSEFDLRVSPFSSLDQANQEEKTIMIEWLEDNYLNVLSSYEGAVRMCSEGNSVECLSNCRNVITGIFSYYKDDPSKWVKGLQNACHLDKNISKVSNPNNIPAYKKKQTHSEDLNLRYNYPRFKTIFQVYSFLSDLGPHKDEATLVNGKVDHETPTMEDSIMGLRFTESILIWLYQNQ